MKPLFLIGFMATGKSTVGKLVAERLGLAFRDLDEAIVREAGMSVAEIWKREGEEGFRRRETAAVRAACREQDLVVATGGGAACREENLAAMLGAGRVVALSATPAEVLKRAGTDSGRPLLDAGASSGSAKPSESLLVAEALLKLREPFYARAHHRIDTVGRTPDEVAEAVLVSLRGAS